MANESSEGLRHAFWSTLKIWRGPDDISFFVHDIPFLTEVYPGDALFLYSRSVPAMPQKFLRWRKVAMLTISPWSGGAQGYHAGKVADGCIKGWRGGSYSNLPFVPGGLVTTKLGRIGMCPGNVRKCDSVYILNGCIVPLLLRPNGDGTWRVVGECLVWWSHGVGRPWQLWREKEFVERDVVLR